MKLALNALLALPLVVGSTATAQTPVAIVGSQPTDDYASLDDALAQAASGTTLLLRPGNYSSSQLAFQIAAKSFDLRPLGDAPGSVELDSPLEILDLTGEQAVVLTDIDLRPDTFGAPLRAADCEGSVWLDGCVLQSQAFSLFAVPPGATTFNCANFVAARCEFVGLSGSVSVIGGSVNVKRGQPGLITQNSSVALFDCSVRAGSPPFIEPPYYTNAFASSPGIAVIDDCDLRLVGGTVEGARGTNGVDYSFCIEATSGANAIDMSGSGSKIVVSDATLVPGAPGAQPMCAVWTPVAGDDFGGEALPESEIANYPGSSTSITVSPKFLESPGTVSIDVQASANDIPVLFISGGPALPLTGIEPADFLIGADAVLITQSVLVMGPSGTTTLIESIPSLPPSATHLSLAIQAAFLNLSSNLGTRFSPPVTLEVVPPGFPN